jgi:signal peptidase
MHLLAFWYNELRSNLSHRKVVASPLAQEQLLLTKGDNNPVDDLELYNGLQWLERHHIVGKVRGYVSGYSSVI